MDKVVTVLIADVLISECGLPAVADVLCAAKSIKSSRNGNIARASNLKVASTCPKNFR